MRKPPALHNHLKSWPAPAWLPNTLPLSLRPLHPNTTWLPLPPSSSRLGFRAGETGPIGVATMVAARPTAGISSAPHSARLPAPSGSHPRRAQVVDAQAPFERLCAVCAHSFSFSSLSHHPYLTLLSRLQFRRCFFPDGQPLQDLQALLPPLLWPLLCAMGSSASASAVVTLCCISKFEAGGAFGQGKLQLP